MECIINSSLTQTFKKGKKLSVLERFIRIKYKIRISESVLLKRVENLKVP